MDPTYVQLADRALELLEKSGKYRVLILLAGAPGSGKSTIAQRVVDILNARHQEYGKKPTNDAGKLDFEDIYRLNSSLPYYKSDEDIDIEDEEFIPRKEITESGELIIRGRCKDDNQIKITPNNNDDDNDDDDDSTCDEFAQVIPMDGFHLTKKVLQEFKDPQEAALRRGSPFTFDALLIVSLVENLHETLKIPSGLHPLQTRADKLPAFFIPNFNHEEKDPRPNAIKIHSSSRILIMEGLYLLLDEQNWRKIPQVFSRDIVRSDKHSGESTDVGKLREDKRNYEFWKVLITDATMLKRVGQRHLKSGIVNTLQEGEERVKLNDLPNGRLVYAKSYDADVDIVSIEDDNEA